MGANQNSSMEFDLYPEINPRSSLLIRQDRVAIEKLSAIGTGLGTMKTQQKITIDASHDTCETMTAKSESKGSSNPHRHFTEHLADVFEEPPRESNLNSKTSSFFIRSHRLSPCNNPQATQSKIELELKPGGTHGIEEKHERRKQHLAHHEENPAGDRSSGDYGERHGRTSPPAPWLAALSERTPAPCAKQITKSRVKDSSTAWESWCAAHCGRKMKPCPNVGSGRSFNKSCTGTSHEDRQFPGGKKGNLALGLIAQKSGARPAAEMEDRMKIKTAKWVTNWKIE
jgi:hypothetical protein